MSKMTEGLELHYWNGSPCAHTPCYAVTIEHLFKGHYELILSFVFSSNY